MDRVTRCTGGWCLSGTSFANPNKLRLCWPFNSSSSSSQLSIGVARELERKTRWAGVCGRGGVPSKLNGVR